MDQIQFTELSFGLQDSLWVQIFGSSGVMALLIATVPVGNQMMQAYGLASHVGSGPGGQMHLASLH